MKVPFNIPYLTGNEIVYLTEVFNRPAGSAFISFADRCKTLLKRKWNLNELFLTNSCTSALEVSASLIDLKPGDEVIIPSYTFPSTANAFLKAGATMVFADSRTNSPNLDEEKIESLITDRTKAIVPVHYGGVACDMDRIMDIAGKNNLYVIEDAAHAFDAFFKSEPLGTIGHLGCISFHQSKNLQCGEGGVLLINDKTLLEKADYILEKGTNRKDFEAGNVERYEWVEMGSSYVITEFHAACLLAQLENSDSIIKKRIALWGHYYNSLNILQEKELLKLPLIPDHSIHNAHIFYLILKDHKQMTELMTFLKGNGIQATVHYTSLDQSIYWKRDHKSGTKNINSLMYNDCLIRLPLFNSMSEDQVQYVVDSIKIFFNV